MTNSVTPIQGLAAASLVDSDFGRRAEALGFRVGGTTATPSEVFEMLGLLALNPKPQSVTVFLSINDEVNTQTELPGDSGMGMLNEHSKFLPLIIPRHLSLNPNKSKNI